MNQPLLSVIVPCYNQGRYLKETLTSVFEQTYSNWECIIVNDGSLDDSEQVALSFCGKDVRFRYYSQHNQGVSVARNNAIAFSKGEYILPLDGDDKIDSTYIEKAVRYYIEHPDTKLVYCKAKWFGEESSVWNLEKYSYERLIWSNMIFCSAVFKRRDYDQTLGYNPNMRKGLEDWDFWLSFLGPKDIVYQIDEVLFYYRCHRDSRNNSLTSSMESLLVQIYQNHKHIYEPYAHNILVFNYQAAEWKHNYQYLQHQIQQTESSSLYRSQRFVKRHVVALWRYLFKRPCKS